MEGVPLRVGERELRLRFSTTAGQSVNLDIRLDLGTDSATIVRFCKDSPATQSPGGPTVSISMCIGSTP
jgi:hypothetical protein